MASQAHAGRTSQDSIGELELADQMHGLALELRERWHDTWKASDLDEAVEMARKAVQMTPHDDIRRADHLRILAELLSNQAIAQKSLLIFDDAIETAHQAAQTVPRGHPDRLAYLDDLVQIHWARDRYWRGEDHVLESITASRNLLQETPEDDPNRPRYCFELSLALGDLYRYTDEVGHFQEAINLARETVRALPNSHHDRPQYLYHFGKMLRDQYVSTEREADATEALLVAREAVQAIEDDHPMMAAHLNSLGLLLDEKFYLTGVRSDLDEAISTLSQALGASTNDDPTRAWLLSDLGLSIHTRYTLTGCLDDLNESIGLARKAVDITARDKPDMVDFAFNLISRLGERHRRTGSPSDLEEAIEMARNVRESFSEDHGPQGPLLHVLGNRLLDRYWLSGGVGDLEEAIDCARQAVDTTPTEDPDWMSYLCSLGIGLYYRHTRTTAITDLDEAIQIMTKVVENSPDGSDEWASYASNLGGYHLTRYKRMWQPLDLDRSIELNRMVVEATPKDSAQRHLYLGNLTSSLIHRAGRTESLDDIDESVQLSREAKEATPKEHIDWPGRLHNLAASLQRRYDKTGDLGDLDEAIELTQQSVAAQGKDHRLLAETFYSLALFFAKRFSATKSPEDVQQKEFFYRAAMSQTQSSVKTRIEAGVALIPVCMLQSNWQQAYEDAKYTVDLIPQLALRSLTSADKQELLLRVGGISSEAAGLALHLGEEPLVALNLLEKGRGVLALSLEEIRADISCLEQKCPDLASRYINLREQLTEPVSTRSSGDIVEATWTGDLSRRYEAGDDFERLLVEIRQQPGFDDFLLPPTESDVKSAAERGPIVIVNTSMLRCDAILIEKHRVRSVPLPDFNRGVMRDHVRKGTFKSYQALEWLWQCIAEPVLTSLGFEQPPAKNEWPHVWWVMTGLLSKFPIHAAGLHTKGSSETVIDRVVSSYHTSIQAIIRGRKRPVSTTTRNQAVLIAMEHTPGSSRLPFASSEIASVRGLCKSLLLDPVEPERKKKDILPHLLQCGIFHYAGHAYTDSTEPTGSYLCLDRDKENSLTVADLLDTDLLRCSPFLAYLSACGTGRIENENLMDEGIHLINGFQTAGFRHVVGTLWEVRDELCVDMARITYEGMLDKGMTDESVSLGLHNACRELRDRWLHMTKGEAGLARRLQTEEHENEERACRGDPDRGGHDPLQRDIVSCDEEPVWPHWIPYVHYGV